MVYVVYDASQVLWVGVATRKTCHVPTTI